MVSSILPLYLVIGLGLTPLHYGIIDGLYQGVTVLVRLAGGVAADRWQRHKEVAAAGYGLSALCKLGLVAARGAFPALAGVIALDRVGKGIRTAPRDALISLSTPNALLASAFGVHRALDTTGAVLGPLCAFALLSLAPGAFDAVFVVSFCAAALGLGILVVFVRNEPARVRLAEEPAPSLRQVTGLLRLRGFRLVLIAGAALSLATVGDGFVYLSLQRRMSLGLGYFPLFYVVTAAVYLALAIPVGRLADRVGRVRVFLWGHLLLMGVYACLLFPSLGWVGVVGGLALFGAYYAATDGVLAALTSALLPPELRSSGLALIATAVAAGRLIAALVFGGLWTWLGADAALLAFLMALTLALGGSVLLLRPRTDVR